jgi:hypothetical protein
MTIKNIKDNQELLNAYNNMLNVRDALDNIGIKHKSELTTLKENLKKAITFLISNPHYEEVADESEKTEIQTLLDSLN